MMASLGLQIQITKRRQQMNNEIGNGATIRGNHGLDIFPREDGYHVEHFALIGFRNDVKVVWTDGPFETIESAAQRMKEYRAIWNG
jgi:hypothetical protein